MNPKYRFYLSTGQAANVPGMFADGQQLNGAVKIDRGFNIPVGSSGYQSYFFVQESPFVYDDTIYNGQILTVRFYAQFTNYAELDSIPTHVLMQRYKNGAFISSGILPTSQRYYDSTSGTTLTRQWELEYRFTADDVQNQWYYRFYIQLANRRYVTAPVDVTNTYYSFVKQTAVRVYPTYKDDLAKDYELETNQRFYRAKLSGKISFIRDDFDLINNAPFDTEFGFYIRRSNDWGQTWLEEFSGKFMKTDCTFNNDDKKVTLQPEVLDEYNDVLAGLEKEYNLIPLAPAIERLLLQKRPLIQIYIPGDSIVSCFLGGSYWEQDANATTDRNALVNTYHFALCNLLKEINVTGSSTPNVNALYTGRMSVTGNNIFTGNLYPNPQTGYYIRASQQYMPPFWGIITYEIVRSSDNVVMFRYQNASPGNQPFDNVEFDFTAVSGSGASGKPHAEMATYNIYARYLLDVTTIQGLNTYELPTDDIVDYNRNYRRAIGYAIDVGFISNNYSTTPTEWGRRDDGTYFRPPYSIYGQTYYPIARSTWRYASIWFGYYMLDNILEVKGRKTYTLRDAYPVGSVIQSLLNQFAPGITHQETAEYSQFLYGGNNPVAYGQNFRLFVTQKSNILVGDYQQPAQKAQTTLQQFTNMLRDCFRCFWYIEDSKFKIEHISWFRNGGSYSGNPVVGTDLTQLENIRNGKKWGFATSEYSFDKVDMPERFQFKWMDDVTQGFEGLPMQVISKYVTAGKIEDINISNFTSDVDMMMLAPGEMSNDGFGLFAAVTANALVDDDSRLYPGFGGATWNDNVNPGWATPRYDIRPELTGRAAILHGYVYPQRAGSFNVRFFRSDGNTTGGIFNVQNPGGSAHSYDVAVTIPGDAVQMGFYCNGAMTIYAYKLEVPAAYELPYIKTSVNGNDFFLQNGYLAFINLQPSYWTYDLPAREVEINGSTYYANGIERKKKQTLTFPMYDDPNPVQLVKTYIGSGEIDKISINLSSRSAKTTLKYDTE